MKQFTFGGSCSFPSMTGFLNDTNCIAIQQGSSSGSSGSSGSGIGMVDTYVLWEPSQVFANDFMAMVGDPDIPPPGWETSFRGCPLESDGLDDETTCVADADAGYDDVVCVAAQGDLTCPQEGYTERTLLHQDLVDTRACQEDCACDASTMQCAGVVELHTQAGCGMPSGSATLSPNMCLMTTALSAKYIPQVNGQCTTANATASGDVKAATPYTLCCTRPGSLET